MDTTSTSPVEALRGAAELHLPGDPGYDAARTPWNLAVDLRPAAVAVPRSVDEVCAVVRAAAAAGLRVAPLSTGHGAAPLAGVAMDDVVLLRLSELTGVTVDAGSATARVVGGTPWLDVVEAAAPHGLAVLHGSAPDVAVAGFVTGGGLSFYGRRHGVTSTWVRAVEVVTADGGLVRADADHHPELFWAVRGGGGGFGVLVAVEIGLFPCTDLVAGMLLWDRDRAPAVVEAWAAWTREVPESVTTALRVMSFPSMPELPPFLSGRDIVVVDGALLEDDGRAGELLAPLRALAPEMDTFARMPPPGLVPVHMDPPGPTPNVTDHRLLTDLPAEAVAAFLAQVGPGTRSGLLFAELRHTGGALGRPAPDGGAVAHLPGAYSLFCVAMAPDPVLAAAGQAAAGQVAAAMEPWAEPRRLPTLADRAVPPAALFDDETLGRLRRVRDEVDPEGRFLAKHHL